jgi:hypothetical protein
MGYGRRVSGAVDPEKGTLRFGGEQVMMLLLVLTASTHTRPSATAPSEPAFVLVSCSGTRILST